MTYGVNSNHNAVLIVLLLDSARQSGDRSARTGTCYEDIDFAGRRLRSCGWRGGNCFDDLRTGGVLMSERVVDL